MQSSRRSKHIICTLLSIASCGGWLVLLLRLSPHPDLLHKAVKTGFSGETPYQWLSSHELLEFDRTEKHRWELFHLDTGTGIKTPLSALQSSLPDTSFAAYVLAPSPDGRQVAFCDTTRPQISTLDGKCLQSFYWNEVKENRYLGTFSPFWLADGRVILIPPLSDGDAPPISKFMRLRVMDTQNPKEERQSTTHKPQAAMGTSLGFLSIPYLPEFRAANYYSRPMITASGLLYTYSSAYTGNDVRILLTLPLAPGSSATKTTIHAPSGLTFALLDDVYREHSPVSPHGDRVFWLCCSRTYTPPLWDWLHRVLPAVKAPSYQWMSLYVSRLNGSDMREVGGIAVAMTPERLARTYSSGIGQEDQERIQDVRWLPDGKHISFQVRRAIYTVDASL